MNLLEVVLAFIEGAGLIASPCILPVLPLVLSTSVDGGKRRPFGIILGFVLAFTIFALLSRTLVAIFHINLDYIKYLSLFLLLVLGLSMFSEVAFNRMSRFLQPLATVGTQLSANAREGFLSGVLIGILIGLVWTPCAGPILAAALVQVIRARNDFNALVLIGAFALGAGIPMLIISLTGRTLMLKLKFLTTHPGLVHKVLGGLILLSVSLIAFGVNPQFATPAVSKSASAGVLQGQVQNGLATPYAAPQFAASDTWLNTPGNQALTISGLKGKVVLVDFWTYSCINCLRTLPYINSWYQKYHDKGLVIVGVHAPEFEFEKNTDNVKAAILRYSIKYPVALDNNLDTWTNYNNQYWPAHYLIDKNGKVVYTSFGEGDYDVTENNIRILLGLGRTNIDTNAPAYNPQQTPETYLGYLRGNGFASPEQPHTDIFAAYTLPKFVPANNWALSGQWQIERQSITNKEAHAKLQLNFTAQHVYLVLGNPPGKPVKLQIRLNGNPVGVKAGKDAPGGIVTVEGNRLYELINQGSVANGLLEIEVLTPGVTAYAFTFG